MVPELCPNGSRIGSRIFPCLSGAALCSRASVSDCNGSMARGSQSGAIVATAKTHIAGGGAHGGRGPQRWGSDRALELAGRTRAHALARCPEGLTRLRNGARARPMGPREVNAAAGPQEDPKKLPRSPRRGGTPLCTQNAPNGPPSDVPLESPSVTSQAKR